MKNSDIYKAAEKRVEDNRIAFPQQAADEDQVRKGMEARSAPPPRTVAQTAALMAAVEILEKN